MARPRTPIGTFGDITYVEGAGGRIRARTRYRDDDGHVRRVSATGGTRRDAERKLKKVIAERSSFRATGELTANSSFTALVDVWLADLDLEGKLAPSTRALYERNMRQLVMPVFEGYSLREITVSKVDRFIKSLALNKSYSMAKQARTVLSLAFSLAVRYDAIQKNPVRDAARLRKPPSQAMSLSAAQVDAVRVAVRSWRRGPGLSGPPPDGQLEHIIEVMLGTSARIGEVLAIRKCDVDVTRSPATVRISGTIVSPAGKPTHRQPHPKTLKSTRTVSVPSFTAAVLRDRLVKIASEDPDQLIFQSRNGTPLTTNNVRRRLRAVMEQAGIRGVTPHSFRRTVATVIDRAGGADLAAELHGHTSSKITKEHYKPSRRATASAAAVSDGYSGKCSSTCRTHRSLTAGSIFFGMVRILPTQMDAALNLALQYVDLGPDHYTRSVNTEAKKRNHIRQLQALGYNVTIEPAA